MMLPAIMLAVVTFAAGGGLAIVCYWIETEGAEGRSF
jgi:hypothetical protein